MNTVTENAVELAAQAWCTEETQSITFEVRLCTAFAAILRDWMIRARLAEEDAAFYKTQLDRVRDSLERYVDQQQIVMDVSPATPVRELPDIVTSLLNDCADDCFDDDEYDLPDQSGMEHTEAHDDIDDVHDDAEESPVPPEEDAEDCMEDYLEEEIEDFSIKAEG